MRICITGASSFIGLPLMKRAVSLGWEVIAVIRPGNKMKSSISALKNTKIIERNLENYNELGSLIGEVDCAVLLAWNGTRGTTRDDEKLQKLNYLFNLQAVKSLVNNGCRRILTAGSQAEYGIANELISETTECRPNTAYGKYKLKFYNEALIYCKEHKVSFKEPRFFSLYGSGDYENSLIMSSIRKMQNNQLCQYTEAMQNWDYLYIEDAIDALVELCVKDCSDGPYNFGSGDIRKLKSYIEEMKTILHSNSVVEYGVIPYGPAGAVSIQPDISKLKEEISWCPKTSFKDGICAITQSMSALKES